MFGMLIFGHLADRYGRKAVYGLELSIVVVATVGMTTASSGHLNSMNVYGWIGFWRAMLGIGLGAEVRNTELEIKYTVMLTCSSIHSLLS